MLLTYWMYQHVIVAILKDYEFCEFDKAEYQFITTAIVLDNEHKYGKHLTAFLFQLFIIVIIGY